VKLISRNAKKDPIIDKFRMGEPYCNDPRCQRNRNGERHKAHLTNEKQVSIYVGKNYCNDPRCKRNRNGERHEAHTEDTISKETTVEKHSDTAEPDTYSYCNDPRCQVNKNGERHRPHSPDNPESYYIKYKGGHKAYPSPTATRMHFYGDRIEVDHPKLVIPYRFMKNIENMHEKKISAFRVLILGLIFLPLAIVGALWKKNHIYTIIRFRDDYDNDQLIIVDFDQNLDSAQSVIYKRMLEFHKRGNALRV
jgi:hypothetical protein